MILKKKKIGKRNDIHEVRKIQICFHADILITMAYINDEGIFKTCLKGIYKMSGSDKKNYLAIEYLN